MDWKEMGVSRYRTSYDKTTSTFRILDVWNDLIKNIPESQLDDNVIPDNSPAVKIINLDEANSLIDIMRQMGWLDKFLKPETIAAIPRSKTLHEVAIEQIGSIASLERETHDSTVGREGVMAIREIIQKLGN
jgi:hypothetical protein